MNIPNEEAQVVSDEDEQEFFADEIVLHNENIERIIQRHDKCKTRINEYLKDLTNQEDADCIKAFYMDTDEILEAMLLLICELFSGKKISISDRKQIFKENSSDEPEREVELKLQVCRKK